MKQEISRLLKAVASVPEQAEVPVINEINAAAIPGEFSSIQEGSGLTQY